MFYREASVGYHGKFGMTALVLFGTSAAYVSSVATFSSGIFELTATAQIWISTLPRLQFGLAPRTVVLYRSRRSPISFNQLHPYLDDGCLSFHCRFSLCVEACGSYCHGIWSGADVGSEN